MNDKVTTIQMSRSRYIERDRSIAVLRLDDHFFDVGEPVMVRYYTDPEKQTEVDTILAVGIKSGTGPDCYKVMSLGGLELVRDVTNELPDVSSLVHGEVYLYQDPLTEVWYYVYELGGDRQLERISGQDRIFVSIENRYRYFWTNSQMKREDDFFTNSMLQETIDELFRIVYPPYIVAESLDGYLFRAGDTKNITLRIQVLDTSGKDLTKNYNFYVDNSPIDLTDYRWTYKGLTASHDFIVKAENSLGLELNSLVTQVQIRFGYDIHYGVVDPGWKPTSQGILQLDFHELRARENVEWKNINLSNQITAFAAPQTYGYITHIHDDNGLDLIADYNCEGVDVDGIPYYVYYKIEPIQINGFIQKFMYNTEDKTEDDMSESALFEQYSEVVEAWKKQGLPGGLTVVGSDGKIPSDLLPPYDSSSYIELVSFVTTYPTSNLTPGNKWFNTKTNKIFTAVTDSSGIVSEPLGERFYVNMKERAIYTWKASGMVNISGAIISDPITSLKDIL